MNNNKHNKHNIQYDMQTDDLINKYTQSNIKINNYTPFILLFFVIIINAYFNSKFQLHFDEAYYWVWGKNLALSYYDHPPMIAYLAKISTYFGLSEFYVRLPNLFCITIALIYIYKLAKDCFNIQVANLALLFAITCPIYEALFFIFTPDSPLLLFWVLTIYYFYKAIFENNTVSFYLAGIFQRTLCTFHQALH